MLLVDTLLSLDFYLDLIFRLLQLGVFLFFSSFLPFVGAPAGLCSSRLNRFLDYDLLPHEPSEDLLNKSDCLLTPFFFTLGKFMLFAYFD